jgi:AcrR family transcriptional regulator
MSPKIAIQPDPGRRLAALKTLFPPEVLGEGSRSVILDKALRLFAERGYGGVSVRDIAAAARLQPASMYAHFPSKEHVLAEICRIGHDEWLRHIQATLLDSQPSPRDQIAAYVKAHVTFHARYPMLAVVCNAEMHMLSSPQLAAPIQQIRKHGQDTLETIVARGKDQGVFKIDDVWLAAAMIGSPGLRVAHWYSPDAGYTPEQVAKAYVKFAWRVLGVPDK